MPIYEYECQACKEVIEAWQNLSDQPLTTCPSCAGSLKKLISQSSFQLKGGGWYADGYSSCPAKKAKGGSDAASSSAPDAGSTGKSCSNAKKNACGCC